MKDIKVYFPMLMLLALFTSCSQSDPVPTSGQFSKYKARTIYRMPASTNIAKMKLEEFSKFQDTKQIIVHCQLDSKHTSSCYRDIFNKKLNHFAKNSAPLDSESLKLIKQVHSFENVKNNFKGINTLIMDQANPRISKVVEKRAKFCEQNSKQNLHKCLNQFVKRDTFTITNNIQRESSAMNGQEYIYVKNIVEHHLKEKLFFTKVKLRRKRSL